MFLERCYFGIGPVSANKYSAPVQFVHRRRRFRQSLWRGRIWHQGRLGICPDSMNNRRAPLDLMDKFPDRHVEMWFRILLEVEHGPGGIVGRVCAAFGDGPVMRLQATADLEPVDLVQITIGPDRPELQDLIKSGIRPRGLGVMENESHPDPRIDLPPALNISAEVSLGGMAQH